MSDPRDPAPPLGDALLGALRDVGADHVSPAEDQVDPLFFHRTLARWLGLPEGRQGDHPALAWEYRFWRAELQCEARTADGWEQWAASLAVAVDGPEEHVRWEVQKDRRGHIVDARWRENAPTVEALIGPPAPTPPPRPTLPPSTVAALFGDDDATA